MNGLRFEGKTTLNIVLTLEVIRVMTVKQEGRGAVDIRMEAGRRECSP